MLKDFEMLYTYCKTPVKKMDVLVQLMSAQVRQNLSHCHHTDITVTRRPTDSALRHTECTIITVARLLAARRGAAAARV